MALLVFAVPLAGLGRLFATGETINQIIEDGSEQDSEKGHAQHSGYACRCFATPMLPLDGFLGLASEAVA